MNKILTSSRFDCFALLALSVEPPASLWPAPVGVEGLWPSNAGRGMAEEDFEDLAVPLIVPMPDILLASND